MLSANIVYDVICIADSLSLFTAVVMDDVTDAVTVDE